MENRLLMKAEQQIKSAYLDLGHDQGWSFLYTPGSTLNSNAKFLFMGLNPGGSGSPLSAELTTEKGNAYNPEVEDWGANGKGSPLQIQIVKLYEMLSDILRQDYRKMMDATLAANFCPFRSNSWSALKEQSNTIRFCEELWTTLLNNTQISTIVCMSAIVRNHMTSIIMNLGGTALGDIHDK